MDPFEGQSENETIKGLGGADIIEGNGGNDVIKGGEPDDWLFGGDGNDGLRGQAGSDFLEDVQGSDLLVGGSGDDFLIAWDDELGHDLDTLDGGAGDDILLGNDGDILIGGADNDEFEVIIGQDGADPVVIRDLTLLHSGKGSDSLSGGEGADTLTGWAGNDVFSYEQGDLADGETITDFTPGRDVLELELEGVSSVSDINFRILNNGLGAELSFGDHGKVILRGEFELSSLRQSANFIFLN